VEEYSGSSIQPTIASTKNQFIASGAFFQLAARLARYTGNTTYFTWAEKTYDWVIAVGLIDDNLYVYDGTDDTTNCTTINHGHWSYNAATFLSGTSVMANITGGNSSSPWAKRTQGFFNGAKATFFSPYANATNVMFEFMCEEENNCDTDQFSFQGISQPMDGCCKSNATSFEGASL